MSKFQLFSKSSRETIFIALNLSTTMFSGAFPSNLDERQFGEQLP